MAENRVRTIAMPQPNDPDVNPLQRDLADAIILMLPLDEIRILLACGAKVNEPVTQGLRALHYAVWQKHYEAVRLLLVRGADINAIDDCGYSALHLAAEHGYIELTRLLLESGAKVDYRPPTDESFPRTTLCDEPLRLAMKQRHYAVAQLLLEYGADPNKRYFLGGEINLASDTAALELLLTFGAHTETRDRAGMTPLMRAARHNSHDGTAQVLLLLSFGADLNAMADARNDFRTVLHYAVLSGNVQLVRLLLKQGARVDRLPPAGESDRPSPLDLAILRGDPGLVRVLLEEGARVNRSSPVIGTPLHVACADNIPHRLEIMKMLLSYGADPNQRVLGEHDPTTVLRPPLAELLASNERVSLAELQLLLRYGARVVMKTQFRDPDGLLNCLANVSPALLAKLIECAEEFDPCMIRRNNYLTNEQKEQLLCKARRPLSLKACCRMQFRRSLGRGLCERVPALFVPATLRAYLLYEQS